MNVVIRTDSSERIGTGHFVRCIALAKALRGNGADVHFLSRDLPGSVGELVQKAGFPLYELPRLFGQDDVELGLNFSDKFDWQGDSDVCAKLLAVSGIPVDWLIVDHYGIDSRWEQRLRKYARRIAVIDDLANRTHDCELLLDSNMQAAASMNRYHELVPEHCMVLQGPKYALLRPEFAKVRVDMRRRDGLVRRILLFFGGTDPTNQTQKTLEAVASLHRPEIAVDVVVGATNPHLAAVLDFCESHPGFIFYCQTDRMAELMAMADLAIGAGGTTIWERCALGLPSIVITVAENQKTSTRVMAEQGRLLLLGHHDHVTANAIARVVAGVLEVPQWLVQLSDRSAELVDGRGANRVARHLLASSIHLRLAEPEDCSSVFAWRNAEETRRYSLNSRIISYAEHERWYRNTLTDPRRVLLIGEIDGEPVGVLRYDLKKPLAKVSVYLVPGRHGQGLGGRLLRSGTAWLREHHPGVHEILADICAENQASLAVFAEAGYQPFYNTYKRTMASFSATVASPSGARTNVSIPKNR